MKLAIGVREVGGVSTARVRLQSGTARSSLSAARRSAERPVGGLAREPPEKKKRLPFGLAQADGDENVRTLRGAQLEAVRVGARAAFASARPGYSSVTRARHSSLPGELQRRLTRRTRRWVATASSAPRSPEERILRPPRVRLGARMDPERGPGVIGALANTQFPWTNVIGGHISSPRPAQSPRARIGTSSDRRRRFSTLRRGGRRTQAEPRFRACVRSPPSTRPLSRQPTQAPTPGNLNHGRHSRASEPSTSVSSSSRCQRREPGPHRPHPRAGPKSCRE